jgi:hypothetical protein
MPCSGDTYCHLCGMRILTSLTRSEKKGLEEYKIAKEDYNWLMDCWMIYGSDRLIKIKYTTSSVGLILDANGESFAKRDSDGIVSNYLHNYCLEFLQKSDTLCEALYDVAKTSTIHYYISQFIATGDRFNIFCKEEMSALDHDFQSTLSIEKFARENKLWMLYNPLTNEQSKQRIDEIFNKMKNHVF